jgi:hypothetical protein
MNGDKLDRLEMALAIAKNQLHSALKWHNSDKANATFWKDYMTTWCNHENAQDAVWCETSRIIRRKQAFI